VYCRHSDVLKLGPDLMIRTIIKTMLMVVVVLIIIKIKKTPAPFL
jgi:hypothetical protein